MSAVNVTGERHPAVKGAARWFDFEHLPSGPIRAVSQQVAILAQNMIDDIPDDPQLALGLQKLIEAKDCLVRAALAGLDHTKPDASRYQEVKPIGEVHS